MLHGKYVFKAFKDLQKVYKYFDRNAKHQMLRMLCKKFEKAAQSFYVNSKAWVMSLFPIIRALLRSLHRHSSVA